MPLSPKQIKVVQEGIAACNRCGASVAQMRQLGYPDEALEQKQQEKAQFFDAAMKLIQEEQSKRNGGTISG